MSRKLFERPKVRFFQPSGNSATNSETPDEPFHSTRNKPRIRSIVTLENPFKIIYNNGDQPNTSKGNVENTDRQCLSKTSRNAETSCDGNFQRSSSSRSHNANPETSNTLLNIQNPLPCTNKSQNMVKMNNSVTNTAVCPSMVLNGMENSKSVPSVSNFKSSQPQDFSDSEPCLGVASKISEKIKTGTIPKQRKTCASKIVFKNATSKTLPINVKMAAEKSATVSNGNVASLKNPIPNNITSKINHQKERTPGKGAVACSSRSVASAKSVACGLKMSKSGNKAWKTRPKSSPVKKSILRDINGHPTNAYVGPGIARYYSQPSKVTKKNEMPHIRPDIVSGEQLGRPEYNSIMCTIDELKKVQAENFVTDVEQLPPVYRNLINEKVSAALDFPPDEVIYRNLVDLSVNENQLPLRVTRSKDPEPRHKDIVPKLSDFFTPTYSDEYCTAVQIRPSNPEISSKWSAFAISDKIFGWKHDMDQCY